VADRTLTQERGERFNLGQFGHLFIVPNRQDGFRLKRTSPLVASWASVGNGAKELIMRFVKGAAKAAIVASLIRVVQKEMSKPENQRKAKEMFSKVQRRRT